MNLCEKSIQEFGHHRGHAHPQSYIFSFSLSQRIFVSSLTHPKMQTLLNLVGHPYSKRLDEDYFMYSRTSGYIMTSIVMSVDDAELEFDQRSL